MVQKLKIFFNKLFKQEDVDPYNYKFVWGSINAVGPLELRQHKRTGTIEWRYCWGAPQYAEWSSEPIPYDLRKDFKGALSAWN